MKKSNLIIIALIVLSFATALYIYPSMPERMASHWNAAGAVDGYVGKFWGVFLMPFISLAVLLLFLLIPRIDPLKANIEKFRKYFDGFIAAILGFFYYLYLLTLAWNKGYRFDMIQFLVPAFAALFYYAGILTERAEPNWFIGIRTPWTLSSPTVWKKTHQLGGKLFKIAALLGLAGLISPGYAIYFVIFPVVFAAVYLLFYSYFEFKKEKKSA